MTISALSRIIREDLGADIENSPALIACLQNAWQVEERPRWHCHRGLTDGRGVHC